MTKNSALEIEISGVLLPLQGARLLLPNVAVSEVVGFQEPKRFNNEVPGWLLGMQEWRQQSIPLVSFEQLAGMPMEETRHHAGIAVCNLLSGNPEHSHVGIALHALPHLIRVKEEVIAPVEKPVDLGNVVLRQVRINGVEAWIPDIDVMASMVQEVLA